MVNNVVVALIACAVLAGDVSPQTLPENPCPGLFQYAQDNGIIYGRMEFSNDLSGYYRLSVNMSVAAYLSDNKNIRLELRTNTNELLAGLPVSYNVYFPIQSVIPKLTRIEFNGRVLCSGPPETLYPGGSVTNMWASAFFRITFPGNGTPFRPNSVYDIEVESVPEITFPITTSTARTPGAPFTSAPQSFDVTTSTTLFQNPLFTPPTTENNLNDRNPEGQCGPVSSGTQQLVVNGDTVEEGQYPWMVAIMYRQNFDYKYRCTGSLVTDRHVVTAAHCVQFFKALLFPIEDLLIVLGKKNIRNWANGAIIRDVRNVTVHPDYQENKGDCDVAVLTTDRPVEFGPTIQPVCTWQEREELDDIVDKVGTVAGWGRDESGRDFVAEAKRINLPVVSQVTCLRSDPGFAAITSSRTFCAGNRNGAGPCTGDSGAGFMMIRNGRWTLRGVVSRALGDAATCDLKSYFVFADLAKVKRWLQTALS